MAAPERYAHRRRRQRHARRRNGDDQIDVSSGNDTVRYASVLDGTDVVNGFDGNASGGQDTLNLDALFDSLSITNADRAGRVSLIAGAGTVDVHVDVSPLHNSSDVITVRR